ncbi:aspartic proteinase CDR1-like [Impatiens glandulifera]|uniref:aspartic proteinase CDR1-like n=1 Tax=Impatiens glandulifera TaxID=253017 RepID=UPI001FB0B1C8|nr:aspartic proteinase CDR1-like [Impatiens glandulifera]
MANLSFYQYSSLFVYLLLQLFSVSSENASKGFSAKFIHRDSPESPLYNSSVSPKERLNGVIQRSISRLTHFKSTLNIKTMNSVKNPTININSTMLMGAGEYIMEFYIGTPPFKQLAIVDTGSDTTWTQCLPCNICFKQKQPIFNSEKSSTFQPLPCTSSSCNDLQLDKTCYKANTTCGYRVSYGDQSYSTGVLATETYTIGGISFPKLVYGCSHASHGEFQRDSSGIVGLGDGTLSLINQFRKTIQRKFSYCLLSDHKKGKNSKINFGSNAVVSGSKVVSTPIEKRDQDTYYYLTLEGMSVGKSRFPCNATTRYGKDGPIKQAGNIIIDSGTTLTFLPATLCDNIENSMKRAINAHPIQDPEGYFTLCYKKTKKFTAPTITAHFAGGADLKLPWTSTFYIDDDLDMMCLGFTASEDVNIYGNIAQRDYLIGYDLDKQIVSFKPTDCSKE